MPASDHQRKSETNSSRSSVYNTLCKIVVLLDYKNGHAKNGTVRGDERQENPKSLIQG
ncbi:MAG: hypothetical protein MZV63_30280 [Marinilabiliales bacterium]|nr:hypothetical protein [Marinilabiliales bacterium]